MSCLVDPDVREKAKKITTPINPIKVNMIQMYIFWKTFILASIFAPLILLIPLFQTHSYI
jgi:hypothetical protein